MTLLQVIGMLPNTLRHYITRFHTITNYIKWMVAKLSDQGVYWVYSVMTMYDMHK